MNSKILERFKEYINASQFNAIKTGLASPEKIKSLSYGEVKKTETINYRTLKPERDGLFCARIFGPVKDWECNCGKYKRMKHRGVTCEKCGVEVIQSRVRRERMGHIELIAPVCHIWYLKGMPSYLSLIMDMAIKDLERVIYFDSDIVINQGKSSYAVKTLISSAVFQEYKDKHPDDQDFKAKSGAEAIYEILSRIDLNEEISKLKLEYQSTASVAIRHKLLRRIKIFTNLFQANLRPEWMILRVLPVLPPDLRPLVPLEGGRFASSDLNELYRRVLNRNIRLKRLIEMEAPSVIIKNEKRMLQESVDALIDNGRRGQAVKGGNKRPLKSLSEMLRGKQGRFRQNLLGKRVDYSGRSVIVVDPELKMNQCGIPKLMAIELFKPYIYAELLEREMASNLKIAKRMVEEAGPEVWGVLEDIVRDREVLLNRAPTLHRLGIQGFYPNLVEDKAIKIHPLVCNAFNADFDGDQMAVHVPLSEKAQKESKALILSTKNILSPANGRPLSIPSQDMVLGMHYMTKVRNNEKGEGIIFSDKDEVIYAFQHDKVALHSKIKLRLSSGEIVDTTVGRVLLFKAFPEGLDFKWVNKVVAKGDLAKLIEKVYYVFGNEATVQCLDKIKKLGFYYATVSGISLSIDDLLVPEEKNSIIEKAEKEVQKIEKLYRDGVITNRERYNKTISIWGNATAEVANKMYHNLELQNKEAFLNEKKDKRPFNPVFMMLESGARGTKEQVKQLVGMRGLMAKPSGEIMETPIKTNFKEGLSAFDYFTSTHGARKGQADTALKTANSGYLTRRLVDVAQDVVVTMRDCKTLGYIEITDLKEGGDIICSLASRVFGRVVAADLKDPVTGELILTKGSVIHKKDVEKISRSAVSKVLVRSSMMCQAKRGICAKCYGLDLSNGDIVDIGFPVGIVAAQSIGEPGTQLTMRTFHIGGTASGVEARPFFKSKHEGVVELRDMRTIVDKEGKIVVLSRKAKILVISKDGRELERYNIRYGSRILVKEGEEIKPGAKLAEWDSNTNVLLTEKAGIVKYVDLVDNITVQERFDETSDQSYKIILEHKNEKYQPSLSIENEEGEEIAHYYLPAGSYLNVENNQKVAIGDVLIKMPQEASKTKDIVGGLPRIAELFEARLPKNPAIMADINGEVVFGGIHRGMRKISIVNGAESYDYFIPKGKQLNVNNGDSVSVGDLITSGDPILHDMLRILGPDVVQKYLLNQVQEIYRLQGVDINDRHIELIIKQMLRKVRIVDQGDTDFLVGDKVDKIHFRFVNSLIQAENKKPAIAKPVLMGITMASLGTESFISAASFQETTRILTEASVAGQVDYLYGLKENVIIGKLIPAGTGIESFRDKYLGEDISDLEKRAQEEEKKALQKENNAGA